MLVSTRVGLKPLRPLQARDVGQLKPASPLRVRNGCFWRIFRPQRCHRFQRLLLRGEQWCRGFQTPNDCRLQRRHGFHMHVACPVGGVALWPRVFRAPDGPAVWPCCLWPRWCFGRRRAWPPARLGVLTSFGAAPRSPPVPSGPSGALHTSGARSRTCDLVLHLEARTGPATAHGHRSLARGRYDPDPPRTSSCLSSITFEAATSWLPKNVARNSPAIISNFEFTSLELQRFRVVSKNDRGKLRAKFVWARPAALGRRGLARGRYDPDPPRTSSCLSSITFEAATLWLPKNVARNSPAISSNFEFMSLELQRFWVVSKNDRGKLRAKFCWRRCRRHRHRN